MAEVLRDADELDDGQVFATQQDADAWRYDGEAEEVGFQRGAQPAQGSLLDRLDALEQRVAALEEDAMQRHIDQTEGMSY